MDYGPAPESNTIVKDWLTQHASGFGHFINGAFTKPKNLFDVFNPASAEKIASASNGTAADVDAAVAAAAKAFKSWSSLSGFERAKHLYALARHIQKRERFLAVLETMDNGKTIRESRDIDVPLVARHFYHHAGWAQLADSEFKGYGPIGVCGQIIPLVPAPDHIEDDPHLCGDRIDNDQNGQFDCGDRACQAVPEACCVREFDDVSCSDGRDNDQNGFTDCKDFGCRGGRFVTVCQHETICNDGRDNDGDDLTDCADSDCTGTAGCPVLSEAGACADGVDNDHDGQIDCCDTDCTADPACAGMVRMENTASQCGDGVDNDCNGYKDCADFSCTSASRGATPDAIALCMSTAENTLARCMDGIDNDGNGFADCAEFSCTMASRGASPEAIAYCLAHTEADPAKCSDGVDNDGNGFTDCADHGCSRSTDPATLAVCFEDVDATTGLTNPANCHDGVDNDGDGSTDCADFDCAENPATSQARDADGGVPTDKCEFGAFCRGA